MKNTRLNTVLFFVFIVFLSACKKDDLPKDTPACIKKEVEKIKTEKVRNPPAKVIQYTYNGQTVYYIPPVCCDIPSQLFDASCNQLCSPDGGITGSGDGKCPDFFTTRSNEKVIWQDDRK